MIILPKIPGQNFQLFLEQIFEIENQKPLFENFFFLEKMGKFIRRQNNR
jgi:hypothetical protein